jgi:hypothetical protein
MRHLLAIALACSAVFGGGAACAQGTVGNGTFQNLDFENAIVPANTPPGATIAAASALPGWMAYIGTTEQSSIVYNAMSLGSGSIGLIGPDSSVAGLEPPIDGNYSAIIEGSEAGSRGAYSIAQTGMIPYGAESISFKANYFVAGLQPTQFVVLVDGHSLNLVVYSVTPSYAVYGGDISVFAGQTATLAFSAPSGIDAGYLNLDDIAFSSQSVPEPGTLALASLGGLALLSIAQQKRQ